MSDQDPQVIPKGGEPQMVPGQKWIRGMLDGDTIVDSRGFMFVWEIPYWPWWFFSRSDIDGELVESPDAGPDALVLADTHTPTVLERREGAVTYDLVRGDQVLRRIARGYPESPHEELRDLVTVDFEAMDNWFEEDIEVFVHPRSPFTRVDALASSRHVVVSIDDVVLADSHKPTVLFETGAPPRFYLPLTDANSGVLKQNTRQSSCPYKGDAHFYSAHIDDKTTADIAWSYAVPRAEALPIAGLICFYNELVDIDIDEERQERPSSHFV